jgi:succinate dehydrogenase / fumarate reductase cytochrome b subunit
MMVLSFQQASVSIPYLLAMGLLGMHLAHGAASVFQTLGFNRPRVFPMINFLGRVLALLIVIGNISIPLSCWLGLIKPVQGVL